MTIDEKIESYNHQIDELAAEIIKQIVRGADKWEMPWHTGIPQAQNMFTGKYYGGKNLLILWRKCFHRNWPTNHWATFNQWRKLKAQIKRGEEGTLICIAIPKAQIDKKEIQLHLFNPDVTMDNSKLRKYFRFRFEFVWNESQVIKYYGAQPGLFDSVFDPESKIEELTIKSKADIRSGGEKAFYKPLEDFIQMPEISRFKSLNGISAREYYYSTLLHELIHWTGHSSRCNRNLSAVNNINLYAFEELVAELGSAILSTHLNSRLIPREDHAKYIKSWLRPLENDFAYFIEALETARAAVFWLFEETMIFPEIKVQKTRKFNLERIESFING